MELVKQINEIKINVTKEEIAKQFVKHYKYNKWDMYSERGFAIEIAKKIFKILIVPLLIVGFIFLLFCSSESTTTVSESLVVSELGFYELYVFLERVLLFLLGILMPLSLIARMAMLEDFDVSDIFRPSISELKIGLDNFYELCAILETDFQCKSVNELLHMEQIQKANKQFELMSHVLDDRIEICKNDNGGLVARDVTTNKTFLLEADSKKIKNGETYNIIIGLGDYIAKAKVEKTNKEDLEDNYESFFDTEFFGTF